MLNPFPPFHLWPTLFSWLLCLSLVAVLVSCAGYLALRSVRRRRAWKAYRKSSDAQLQAWVRGTTKGRGEAAHVARPDGGTECVPDFSCCKPELEEPRALREAFARDRHRRPPPMSRQATVRPPPASGPLPFAWLYEAGPNEPPAPWRMGTGDEVRAPLEKKIAAAARYAVRASTMNGQAMDFDPDAMVQNFIVGMLGYHTADGYPSDQPKMRARRA